MFHEGACADTMEYNGKYMMKNNYEGSKIYSIIAKTVVFHSSMHPSASTYGNGTNGFVEKPEAEEALNPYAYSKLLFDHYVRKYEGEYTAQVVGLRYFNVYGP